MSPQIAVNNVSKSFDGFDVLKHISFSVQQGEVLGIIGKNGAGKSTLLKVLAGIMSPSSGEVIHSENFSAILDIGTGFIPTATGIENIKLNGSLLGLSPAQIASAIDEVIEFSELGNAVKKPLYTYSSGMYLRLAFSVAVVLQSKTLLIDEVISVGDESFQRKSMQKLRSLAKEGRTIVLASHDLKSTMGLCDRILLLEQGEIVEQGNVAEITRAYVENSVFKDLFKEVSWVAKPFANDDNQRFKPLSISLNRNTKILDTSDELRIRFEYEILSEDMVFAFILKDEYNNVVFPLTPPLIKDADVAKQSLLMGKHALTFFISPFFLNAGIYSLDLIVDHCKEKALELEGVLSFKLKRSKEHQQRIQSGDTFNGPILKELKAELA